MVSVNNKLNEKFLNEVIKLNPKADEIFLSQTGDRIYISDFDILSLKIPVGYIIRLDGLFFTNGENIINISLYG